jgi:hypothetical protein
MGFKSRSTPGGGGFSEMVIHDRKGKELINIHSQKDMVTTVQNTQSTLVNGPHQTNSVAKGFHVTTVHKKIEMASETEHIHLRAATSITLGVGAAKIHMDADGYIRIEGVHVDAVGSNRIDLNINSATPPAAPATDASPYDQMHPRYQGLTQPVGDAVGKADAVLSKFKARQPVSEAEFNQAFQAVDEQKGIISKRTDWLAEPEAAALNLRSARLGQEAVLSGLNLTPDQSSSMFGSGWGIPAGDNVVPTTGYRGLLVRQNGGITNTIENLATFPTTQLDKKFKHASDFGLQTTKKNGETLGQYGSALKDHLSDAATYSHGTYLFVPESKVYFNPSTNNATVFTKSGEYVSGWKLAPGTPQFNNYIKNGTLR